MKSAIRKNTIISKIILIIFGLEKETLRIFII